MPSLHPAFRSCYAIINRARGPCEEIFVLTFKAYGPNAVRSMPFGCQNKYFPYGPISRLIRASLYTYPNKTVQDETLLSQSVVYCVSAFPVLTSVRTPINGLPLSQSDQRIRSVFQSVNNNT